MTVAGVFLLVVRTGVIQGIGLDPQDQSLNHIQTIATEYDAYDVDFDLDGGFIYWSEAMVANHEEDGAIVGLSN